MNSRDKLFIVNWVCSKFSLNSIKGAREEISKLLDPDSSKNYRGPNNAKSDREKSVHALEGIISMLHSIDQSNTLHVSFVCPNDELHIIWDFS